MTVRRGTADEQRHALNVARGRADFSVSDLWLQYFALGGDAGMVEVEAYLHGLMPLPSLQRDTLAHAVNERLDDLTTRLRVPYSRVLRDPAPAFGPLAALAGLLDETPESAPEQLVSHLSKAATAIGVRAVLHLVDYGQRELIPVQAGTSSADGLVSGVPLGVESTMAGQAFQRGRTVASDGTIEHRIWVPVLDGNERLGVLEIAAADDQDLTDPHLRQECRWVADLIGHLITAVSAYGDAFDSLRRTRPRSTAAELVWTVVPPLTAATDRFAVAAQFEPASEVGGDAFDYALSGTTAHLAIFDATGHSLGSGLAATAALAGYRNARRSGAGLFEQAQAIDDIIATHFADRVMLVSGVLAEVEVLTGRLRYVVAGHPRPLLLRDGKVVKTLTGGARVLFGLTEESMVVAEEHLQPGDRLLLYTDGVSEARNHQGRFFGTDRLEDFLERADSAGFPPPETVRRLVRAVMDHQGGRLQDDATVLLASWSPPAAAPSSLTSAAEDPGET